MPLTVEEVKGMKVVELRAELSARGVDSKGVKAVLVDRLLANLDKPVEVVAEAATITTPAAATVVKEDEEVQEAVAPQEEKRATRASDSPAKVAPPVVSPVKAPVTTSSPVKAPVTPVTPVKAPVTVTSPVKVVSTGASSPVKAPVVTPVKAPVVSAPSLVIKLSPIKTPAAAPAATTAAPATQAPSNGGTPAAKENGLANATPTTPAVAAPAAGVVVKDEKMEVDEATSNKRKREDEENANAAATNANNEEDKKDVKKVKVEPVAASPAKKTPAPPPVVKVVPENEPEFDEEQILLDWYKSDLNLKISKENFLSAEPILFDEFPFAYAAAKGTHGFSAIGTKAYYEVKYVKNMDVRADFGELESKHVLRVGWSELSSELQLGEEKLSCGWDSKGKIWKGGEVTEATDKEGFVEGDIIGAYLEIEETDVKLRWTRNGKEIATGVLTLSIGDVEDIEKLTWFPHVLSRNVTFAVNFSADVKLKEDLPAPLDGFYAAGSEDTKDIRVRGPRRPEKKGECELLMLVGLACSGKTHWAKNYVKTAGPEKSYAILGTSTVVERSVRDVAAATGPSAPKAYDSFMNKAGKFVERLVDLAPSRRRNYILDQSNVLPSVQRRKAGGFEGFMRRAVVVLPSDEEYVGRIKAKEAAQGKAVPKSTILDMKASFQLPEVGDIFTAVDFPELPKAEAAKLVAQYNKEGLDAGYGRSGGGGGSGGGERGSRGGGRGGFRGGRGGHFSPRGRGGFMRGGPRGGGARGGLMMRGPPRPPMRGGPPMRPPPPFVRGGRGGGAPLMHRGPPPVMRGAGGPPPPLRGGMRGPPLSSRPPHPPRGGGGGGGGGSWQRASGAANGGGGSQRSRGGMSRGGGGGMGRGGGGGGGGWGSNNKNLSMGGGNRGPPPQVWQQQPPPQQQQQQPMQGGGVWAASTNRGFSGGFGGVQGGGMGGVNQYGGAQMQQQQPSQPFVDPWVQHQQVPDQGFGRSWDNMGGGGQGGQGRASGGGGGGGTWQGYGGQQFGGFGGGGRR